MENSKTNKFSREKIVIYSLIAVFLAAFWISVGFIANHGKSVEQVVKMDNAMKKSPLENDSVTVAIIKQNDWILSAKSHIDEHHQYAWKLKSGNYVINLNYIPDNKFWKWNVGEQIPEQLILELLSIDEMLHETYNLHVERQK
jgi:hypothetical protein